MKIAQKITWLMMFLMVTACSTTSTTMVVDPEASAQVKINETEVMLIIGGSHGKGLVDLNGEVSAFKLNGIKLGGIGVDNFHMTGNVYNLSKIEDFEGTYFEAEAGASAIKGAGGSWLKNDKGVSIHLSGSATGIAIGLGVEGVEITLL